MKRRSLIAVIAAIMIMASAAFTYAATGFELVSSYPTDGQKNTSIENLGVKLEFSKGVNSKAAKKANKKLVKIVDEDNKAIPVQILFSDDEEGLVLVVADVNDEDFSVKNNSEYRCIIDADFVDNDGETLGEEQVITFKTYNQKVNNLVNMLMMFVMFGGIMFVSMRQQANNQNENEAEQEKEAFNPYKEAKRTGKSVEEVKEEQAKKEAKAAAKRKKKKNQDEPTEKKIENCAQYLNNVYHVHAPAPISKEDRSIEALRAMRRAEKKAAKAAAAAGGKKSKKK